MTKKVAGWLFMAAVIACSCDQANGQPKIDAFGDALPKGAIARIGTLRFRHGEPISSLAMSKDGAVLASGGSDRWSSARVWDAKTGKQLLAVEKSGGSVALSPDGQTLVTSGGFMSPLRFWDVKSGKETRQLTVQSATPLRELTTGAVAYSPNGKQLAVAISWISSPPNVGPAAYDARICLVDLVTGKTAFHLATNDDRSMGLLPFAFSPNGKMLATVGGEPPCVHLWETATGGLRAKLTKVFGLSCAFSPDGKTLAVGQSDAIRLIDLVSEKEIRALVGFATKDFGGNKIYTGPGPLAFSPDGKQLAAGGTDYDDDIRIWDTSDGRVLARLTKEVAYGAPLAFTPDGKELIAANGPAIRRWDIATGKENFLADVQRSKLSCAVFSRDGNSLAVGSGKGVRLYDTTAYKELGRLHEPWVRAIAFTADGKQLATAGAKLSLLDIGAGKKVRSFDGHKLALTSVALTSDGKTLYSSSYDGTVRAWNTSTGEGMVHIESPWRNTPRGPSAIQGMSMVPESKWFACQSEGRVFLWDPEKKQVVRTFDAYDWHRPVCPMAVSPDGRLLACEGSQNDPARVIVYHLDGSKPARYFATPLTNGESHWGLSFAFSPDAKTLASGSADKSVRLWDVGSGKELRRFEGHVDQVASVTFAPNGKTLASASWDGTVLIWDADRLRP